VLAATKGTADKVPAAASGTAALVRVGTAALVDAVAREVAAGVICEWVGSGDRVGAGF
jgi:hypothetical protein